MVSIRELFKETVLRVESWKIT